MDLYTLVFVGITVLVLIGITLFFIFLNWLDKKIDKKNRLGGPKKRKDKQVSDQQ